jgi:hypothetical protein
MHKLSKNKVGIRRQVPRGLMLGDLRREMGEKKEGRSMINIEKKKGTRSESLFFIPALGELNLSR